jgi:CDI toxin RNase A-like protein
MRFFHHSVWFVLLLISGCGPTNSTTPAAGTAATPGSLPSSVTRDLSRDESEGGHTLLKHVGRTDSDLRERLRRERRIAAASSYTDRETAERAVGAAIQQQQSRIANWLDRAGGHPNLVLDYDAARPLGRTMRRGEEQSEPCSHAVVVMKWIGPANYYVLTSYPECR